MACNSCGTGSDGKPKGCKSNGTCATDSCNKLTVFDWLSNMELPQGVAPFNYVEVRFKNGRKLFFENSEHLTLSIGDVVATEADSGHDIGIVTLTGELVKVQMRKKKVRTNSDEVKKYIERLHKKILMFGRHAEKRKQKFKLEQDNWRSI